MADEGDVQRDLGRMENQIKVLIGQVQSMDKKLNCIETTLSEARGGWRTLIWIAGSSATVGAAVAHLLQFFQLKPPGG